MTAGRLVPVAALLALLAAAPAAPASNLLTTTVTAADAEQRRCTAKPARGAGVVKRTVAVERASVIQARLTGARGDWDLAVFDARSRPVAGSAAFKTRELAEGFAAPGTYTVQACRRSGRGRTATLDVDAFALPKPSGKLGKPRLVEVDTPTDASKRRLQALGLDLTGHGDGSHLGAVLYSDADERTLRRAGLSFETVIADLYAREWEVAKRNARFARRAAGSDLPSGREDYRRLQDFQEEMKQLVEDHPELVKPVVLPHPTHEGRQVAGIEIAENVRQDDGRPVFLQMGVHHAREWPSAEMPMEFAHDLVQGYGDDARTTRLMRGARTIVVPVVNPDGYNLSREALVDLGFLAQADPYAGPLMAEVDPTLDQPGLIAALVFDQEAGFYAYKRRNCRVPAGECADRDNRLHGVDPNRNYGGFWGGGGASTDETDDTYRGPGPFSEPETQNVRRLVSQRQVTALITNHTFSNLVLRPPGLKTEGATPDEPIYKALGDAMAKENGYSSQFSYQLYDTTGTTEDWSYYATGGLGFTFEIGPDEFHPPYEDVVAEYTGETATADKDGYDGKGNGEAYFVALEHTASTANHGVLTGRAPQGTTIRLHKAFDTWTSAIVTPEGLLADPIAQRDVLDTAMTVGETGDFVLHANPSQRPFAEKSRTLLATTQTPTRSTPMEPSAGSLVPSQGVDDYPFTVAPDDDLVRIAIEVPANSDYDLYVYKGDPDAEGNEPVGSSTGFLGADEKVVLSDGEPGEYVARVENYLGAEGYSGAIDVFPVGNRTVIPAAREQWTLTCERDGHVLASRPVDVRRGERVDLGEVCAGAAGSAGRAGRAAGSSGSTAGGKRALRYRLTVRNRKLRAALRRGLRAKATCSLACTVRAKAKVSRGVARRHRLRSRTVARGAVRRSFTGRRAFKIRFKRAAQRRLRHARRVSLKISGAIKAAEGGTGRARLRLALRRR